MKTFRMASAIVGLSILAGSLPATLAVAADSPLAATVTPFRKEPFTDVASSHPNFDAIEYLRTQNVLKGYLDGTFKPANTITRAEFVAILTNPYFLSGQRSNDCLVQHFGKDARGVFFFDVKRDSEEAQDICEAVVHGIVNGYPDGSFKPRGRISFVEAAKVVANVLAIKVTEDKTATWYTPYVKRLADVHAIPTSIKRFDQQISRAEMAEIVFRVKSNNTKKASMSFGDLR